MGKCGPFGPGPDVPLEEPLIWTIGVPLCPKHGVVRGFTKRFSEHLPDMRLLRTHPDPPATAKYLNAMSWIISHEMKMFIGLEPIIHSRLLSAVYPRIKISGHKRINLRVERGEEPPQHREDLAGVPHRTPGEAPCVAEIQELVLARHITEFWEQTYPVKRLIST